MAKANQTQVEIKHCHTVYLFGRNIVNGALYQDGKMIFSDDSIAAILRFVQENDLEIINAQEILDLVVRQQGYGA